MVDQIFSIGVLAFILALVILMKDIIDGGTFAPSERRSALLGFGLAGILVLSALTMSMISSDTINHTYDDNPVELTKWSCAGANIVSNYYDDNTWAVSPASDTNCIYLRLYLNSSIVTPDFIQSWREVSFNVSGQYTNARMLQYNSPTTYLINDFTLSYDSTEDVTKINKTLTSVEAMAISSQIVSNVDFVFEFVSASHVSTTTLVEHQLQIENDAELANFLIWAVMSFALYIPLMIYLDAFNNIRRFVNNPLGNNRRTMRRMRR